MNAGNYCYILRMTLWASVCWLTFSTKGFPQDYVFDVETINVEDGLPHRNTYDIVQDKDGFIWVSTLAGISRYDGYTFKTYSNIALGINEKDAADYLATDARNRIWYAKRSIYPDPALQSGIINSKRDSIYRIETISEGRFTSKDILYIGNSTINKDHIIIVTRTGFVYEYDGAFTEIYRSSSLRSGGGYTFCNTLPDGSYWLVKGKDAVRIKDGKKIQHSIHDLEIQRVVAIDPELIVETRTPYLGRYWKLDNGAFAPLRLPGDAPEAVWSLLQMHPDYSCYTTRGKLMVQDQQGHIVHTEQLSSATDVNHFPWIFSTLTDRQGILWAATGNGLLKLSIRKNPFTNIRTLHSLRGIYREGDRIWIADEKGTIKNIEGGVQKNVLLDFHGHIYSFYKDHKKNLWMGTSTNAIIRYLPDTDTYTTSDLNMRIIAHLMFQNTLTGHYWLGSNYGMFRFHPLTQKLTPLPLAVSEKAYIRQFYQNDAGIWGVSRKGLFLMDAHSETLIKHYTVADGLPFDDINYLHEDSQGIFWLGTKGGGLIRWNIQENSFRSYTRNNGLSNNNIYAVYEDDDQTLWLPSDHGLMAFDKNTETARVYLPRHGILHEEFNTFSHFQYKDGTLYFGGLAGLTTFHPKALRQEETTLSPPLYVTKVSVLEHNAESFTDKTAGYRETQKIRLKASDRILEVELVLLDYEKPAENQYTYKLEGKQEQWLHTRENKITIINPPYGRYHLMIRARGASGNWSENPLRIPVYVPLPFYLQWWFITGILWVAATGIITAVRWRVQKLKKDRKRLEQKVQQRTRQIAQDKKIIEKQAEDLKALDKAKSRFFANITHEFRTPLTLILGPIEQMIANGTPTTLKAKMRSVKHNAGQLLSLINQILDISKLENGQMEIRTSTDDIVAFTRKLLQAFEYTAAEKRQQLIFDSALEHWTTHFDREKYKGIVYNLLSNATKYSPERAMITLMLSKIEIKGTAHIRIKVKDTGIGITPEKLPHIFDRFYQADDSTTRRGRGTGIGLALVKELVTLMNGEIRVKSQPGKGSVFTVTLPVLTAPEDPDTAIPPEVPEIADEMTEEIAEPLMQSNPETGQLKLLIIEDNAQMRAYIRSCMDASMYHITEAADGAAGIAKAQEIVPDLIISDVMMPEKDGFEVTHAIRSHIATSHIPLILLTAKASEESRLEGISRGADAYLVKPFNPRELRLRIKKLIGLRELLRKRYQDQEPPQASTVFEREDRFISELKAYINDRISDPDLNVEAISRHFSMSRTQFYLKFSALMNTSIGSYIRSVRLETAVKLIKEEKLSIAEAAYASGFSSPSHFSRVFKKAYGKTPSELRSR